MDPNKTTIDTIRQIQKLLGDVVLIPIRPLSKVPVGKGWQKRTQDSMRDENYLRSFDGKNIGVLLGRVSDGLCTIDLDTDDQVEPLLDANPCLRNTLRTKRIRGCNIWIYVEGELPASTKLRAGGEVIGEWRAGGNQTVIWGQAMDKTKGETSPTEYKFLNEVPPIRTRFSDLVFPEGNFSKNTHTPATLRLPPECCVTASLNDCVSVSLHNKADEVLANINSKRDAMDLLATKHPNLAKLYTELVELRFQAKAHARNDFIVQAVTFLYRAVAPQFILDLVGCFYDCNRALFRDPRKRHIEEAEAALDGVTRTYLESLAADERRVYEALDETERNAFRICRDLAMTESPKNKAGEFFMSFNQLGDRLGIFPPQAQRVMWQLEIYGLIKLLEKGTRRAVGVRGKAGIYSWLLSTPD
jgi:hypothetical protein